MNIYLVNSNAGQIRKFSCLQIACSSTKSEEVSLKPTHICSVCFAHIASEHNKSLRVKWISLPLASQSKLNFFASGSERNIIPEERNEKYLSGLKVPNLQSSGMYRSRLIHFDCLEIVIDTAEGVSTKQFALTCFSLFDNLNRPSDRQKYAITAYIFTV